MELIIKTAIADAALYLYDEKGATPEGLFNSTPVEILSTAKECQIAAAAMKRADQLRAAESKPVIAELLIVGPSGETVASVGGAVSRMVVHEPDVKIPRAKLEALKAARDSGDEGYQLAAINAVLEHLEPKQ